MDRAGPATTHDPGGAADPAGLPAPVFAHYAPDGGSLGAGGEAHLVMRVRHRESGELRVVKVYGVVNRPDPTLFDRLRQADHEHLVRLYEWGEHTDEWQVTRCWEVMEYVEAGSLARLIGREGPRLPDDLIRAVLREVAAALHYLHQELAERGDDLAGPGMPGLAHRDIKPENVLVRRRHPLGLVLCDFGRVATVRATRISTSRAGTPLYQAPETWWRGSREPSQDWWALGIMVAEMLIGRNPNANPDGSAPDERVLFEHLATHDVDLAEIADDRWRLLCAGLLTRNPQHRWGFDEIGAWLSGGAPAVHAGSFTPWAGLLAARPLELAGVRCRSLPELAGVMHEHWRAAPTVFRERLPDLREWLDGQPGGGEVPVDLVRGEATDQWEAHRRVARLVSQFAPHLAPRFAGQPADAAGLAGLARQAAAGDRGAGEALEQVDGGLLVALSRHPCRTPAHTCPDGCALLRRAAGELDPAREALRRQAAGLDTAQYHGDGTRAAVRAALQPAEAVLLGVLLDPALLAATRSRLGGSRLGGSRAARRSGWWASLAETAHVTDPGERLAATVLAAALRPVAVADDQIRRRADRQRRRDDRQRRRAARGGRSAYTAGPRAGAVALRGLRADLANLLLVAILTYLAIFVAMTGHLMFELPYSPANGRLAGEIISHVQARLLPPVLVLAACLLVRPRRPRDATGRAWLLVLGVAVAAAVAYEAGRWSWVDYPVVVSAGLFQALAAVNTWFAGWFAVVALVIYTPALIYCIRRLRERGRATPAAGHGPLATAIRSAVFLAVVAAYLLGTFGGRGPLAGMAPFQIVLWS